MMEGFAGGGMVRTIETTYYEAIASLCTGISDSFLRRESDMIICSSGLPLALLNGVLGPEFTSNSLSERAEVAMSHFRRKRLPMRWVLGPSSTPPELDDFLLSQGLVSERKTPGMAIELRHVDREPLPPGLEVQQIENMKSLRICSDILAEVFEIPKAIRDGWRNIIKSYGMSSRHLWFLGHQNGKPVAASLLVFHEDVAGIYCVATISEARGKGIGSAITREPLLVARNAGYDVAVLEASEMGLSVYRRLGFRELCEFRTFTWSP